MGNGGKGGSTATAGIDVDFNVDQENYLEKFRRKVKCGRCYIPQGFLVKSLVTATWDVGVNKEEVLTVLMAYTQHTYGTNTYRYSFRVSSSSSSSTDK